MGSLGIGGDGGGSIRGPASFCGLFGMKPSFGRVPAWPGCRDPRHPGLSSWESLEHLGPLTRTVADAALLLAVIAGPDGRDRHSLPAGDVDWLAAPGAPAGFSRKGLPVGLQIVGRHLADTTVLTAAAFERARPWSQRWPALAREG